MITINIGTVDILIICLTFIVWRLFVAWVVRDSKREDEK